MRTVVTVLLVCTVSAAVAAAGRALDQAASDTRGSRTVQLAVSVRDGARLVAGLTDEDFVLTDNEVPQTVDVLGAGALAVDVTLIVDTKVSTTHMADRLTKDLQQITRVLRKDDAFRVLRIDTFVEELRPMSAVTGPVQFTWRNGLSSLHDALIAALVRPSVADRQQLIVAITDGMDTTSATTADRVREVASRSDALLEIVTVRPAAGGTSISLRPRFRDDDLLILTEAAERTGGELRSPGLFGDADLVTAFTRVFDEWRQGYVLRYKPANVEHGGWHELSVAVPRVANAVVRARRGYHVN